MTNCKKCDQRTEGEINFCTNCGQYQKEDIKNYAENNAYFLNILCVLTIIGSVFTMGRGYLYEMVSMMDSESNYFRGWIYLGSALGT
ncbi:hypothetical protein N9R81_00410 [Flavobacteriales bacterium]|nr:hypothetical protein [Flavobacteriales bacterium]